MSGIGPKSSGDLRGSKAGESRKRKYIRRACPSHFELFRQKIVLVLAPVAFFLIFLAPSPVFSQTVARTLSGRVRSDSGVRVPNAHLSILNTGNGNTATVTGKEDGSYSVPNLAPGNYEVTASGPDFESASVPVTIRADADAVADFVLNSGKGQAGSSTVSGVVNCATRRQQRERLRQRFAWKRAGCEPWCRRRGAIHRAHQQLSGTGWPVFWRIMRACGRRWASRYCHQQRRQETYLPGQLQLTRACCAL